MEVPYEGLDPTGPGALYEEYSADPALTDKRESFYFAVRTDES